VNASLLTLLATPRRIDLFGLDDRGLFGRLARASSWSETRAILAMLPACRRRLTLVAAGELPPPSLLDGLASDLERLVLVPGNWLAALPRHQPRLRARHAARLAALHLDEPIHTVTVLRHDDLPF
jgi:hypothetical protein